MGVLVLASGVIGCKGVGRAAPEVLESSISFDGGAPLDMLPDPLPGNVLPLDGGVDDNSVDATRKRLGELVFTVRDADTRQPMPARVIFRPPPHAGFGDNILGGNFDVSGPGGARGAVVGPGVVGSPEGVLLQNGIGVVPVPPGTYDIFITRGPEWDAIEAHVSVAGGKSQPVNAWLERSVDTTGWLAADLHVHMASSFDSKIPMDRRIISMATSGIEMMVTTDHHNIVDALPMVRQLGYGPADMTSIIGDELNFNEGHMGLYPVAYQPLQPYGGSPPYQAYNGRFGRCDQPWIGLNCYSDVDAFPLMHSLYPNAVLTINHPYWPGGNLGYFTNILWGAGTLHPLPSNLHSAGLFDAMELLNGYQTHFDAEQALLSDWFYLLSQGHRITALGSSDTHRINWVRAGFPRSWIRLPTERPGDVTPDEFAQAIKNQRVIASTGPFLTMTADGGEIGDVVRPKKKGHVTVDIMADVPNWMSLDTVQLFVDGVSFQKWTVKPGQKPAFAVTATVPVTTDSWLVVIAGGKKPLPPDVVGEYAQNNGYQMLPWAVTNPIFVDANGDGWHPVKTWRGQPVLSTKDYGWDQIPMPQKPASRPDSRLPVPVDCDPNNPRPLDEEPPLDAMQLALPLLMQK